MTTSTKPPRNGIRQLNENPNRAERPPPRAATSSIPAPTSVKGDNVVNKRKSILPQRSISIKGRRDGFEKPHEPSGGGGQRQQCGPEEAPEGPPAATRRPSPEQPEGPATSLPTKSVPPKTRTDPVISRPTSPSKSESKCVPGSPTKTQMLPPPRPLRSASLRQPSAPKAVSSSAVKGHTRHRSQVLGATQVSLAGRQSDGTSSSAARPTRPQFSTFQQHFSPKKKPEPPKSAVGVAHPERHPKELTPASRPDVAALQTEYLQLYLLRSSTAQKDVESRISSERHLRKQYDSVTKAYRRLRAQENHTQTTINLTALQQWSGNIDERESRDSFASQLQTLSRVIQEVTDLSEPHGGRYLQLVRTFEQWMRTVERIKESRKELSSDAVRPEEPAFIHPLDQAWKDEIRTLNAKVELCLRELQSLGICKLQDTEQLADSALFRIAKGHEGILAMMVDELKAMQKIEVEVVNLERSWIAHAADQLRSVDYENRVRNARRGAWNQS